MILPAVWALILRDHAVFLAHLLMTVICAFFQDLLVIFTPLTMSV
jgi:hypothetical protein